MCWAIYKSHWILHGTIHCRGQNWLNYAITQYILFPNWFKDNSDSNPSQLTRWIIPAAVNQTDINMETSCARRIELDVFNTFKYCNISGTVMSRSARRKRRPIFHEQNQSKTASSIGMDSLSGKRPGVW